MESLMAPAMQTKNRERSEIQDRFKKRLEAYKKRHDVNLTKYEAMLSDGGGGVIDKEREETTKILHRKWKESWSKKETAVVKGKMGKGEAGDMGVVIRGKTDQTNGRASEHLKNKLVVKSKLTSTQVKNNFAQQMVNQKSQQTQQVSVLRQQQQLQQQQQQLLVICQQPQPQQITLLTSCSQQQDQMQQLNVQPQQTQFIQVQQPQWHMQQQPNIQQKVIQGQGFQNNPCLQQQTIQQQNQLQRLQQNVSLEQTKPLEPSQSQLNGQIRGYTPSGLNGLGSTVALSDNKDVVNSVSLPGTIVYNTTNVFTVNSLQNSNFSTAGNAVSTNSSDSVNICSKNNDLLSEAGCISSNGGAVIKGDQDGKDANIAAGISSIENKFNVNPVYDMNFDLLSETKSEIKMDNIIRPSAIEKSTENHLKTTMQNSFPMADVNKHMFSNANSLLQTSNQRLTDESNRLNRAQSSNANSVICNPSYSATTNSGSTEIISNDILVSPTPFELDSLLGGCGEDGLEDMVDLDALHNILKDVSGGADFTTGLDFDTEFNAGQDNTTPAASLLQEVFSTQNKTSAPVVVATQQSIASATGSNNFNPNMRPPPSYFSSTVSISQNSALCIPQSSSFHSASSSSDGSSAKPSSHTSIDELIQTNPSQLTTGRTEPSPGMVPNQKSSGLFSGFQGPNVDTLPSQASSQSVATPLPSPNVAQSIVQFPRKSPLMDTPGDCGFSRSTSGNFAGTESSGPAAEILKKMAAQHQNQAIGMGCGDVPPAGYMNEFFDVPSGFNMEEGGMGASWNLGLSEISPNYMYGKAGGAFMPENFDQNRTVPGTMGPSTSGTTNMANRFNGTENLAGEYRYNPYQMYAARGAMWRGEQMPGMMMGQYGMQSAQYRMQGGHMGHPTRPEMWQGGRMYPQGADELNMMPASYEQAYRMKMMKQLANQQQLCSSAEQQLMRQQQLAKQQQMCSPAEQQLAKQQLAKQQMAEQQFLQAQQASKQQLQLEYANYMKQQQQIQNSSEALATLSTGASGVKATSNNDFMLNAENIGRQQKMQQLHQQKMQQHYHIQQQQQLLQRQCMPGMGLADKVGQPLTQISSPRLGDSASGPTRMNFPSNQGVPFHKSMGMGMNTMPGVPYPGAAGIRGGNAQNYMQYCSGAGGKVGEGAMWEGSMMGMQGAPGRVGGPVSCSPVVAAEACPGMNQDEFFVKGYGNMGMPGQQYYGSAMNNPDMHVSANNSQIHPGMGDEFGYNGMFM